MDAGSIKKSHVKLINLVISVLRAYGFEFEGLADGRITSKVANFGVYYPDDPSVISVLYLAAKKASGIRPYKYSDREITENEVIFTKWNYRLLAEGFVEYRYNDVYVSFRDSLHRESERSFINAFHAAMLERGYFIEHYPGRGGGHISYFMGSIKEPFYFDVRAYGGFGMCVDIRIRNAQNCVPYLGECSEEIRKVFRTPEDGCGNPHCGIRYEYEGKQIRRCGGCLRTAFEFEARVEDIPHYIRLSELGVKK